VVLREVVDMSDEAAHLYQPQKTHRTQSVGFLTSWRRERGKGTDDIRYRRIKASICEVGVGDEDQREVWSGDGDEAHDGHLDARVPAGPDVDERRAERAGEEGDGEEGGEDLEYEKDEQ
jgi:hypothetical protein